MDTQLSPWTSAQGAVRDGWLPALIANCVPSIATQPSTSVFVPLPRGETSREEQLKNGRNVVPEGEVLLYTATLT